MPSPRSPHSVDQRSPHQPGGSPGDLPLSASICWDRDPALSAHLGTSVSAPTLPRSRLVSHLGHVTARVDPSPTPRHLVLSEGPAQPSAGTPNGFWVSSSFSTKPASPQKTSDALGCFRWLSRPLLSGQKSPRPFPSRPDTSRRTSGSPWQAGAPLPSTQPSTVPLARRQQRGERNCSVLRQDRHLLWAGCTGHPG